MLNTSVAEIIELNDIRFREFVGRVLGLSLLPVFLPVFFAKRLVNGAAQRVYQLKRIDIGL